MLPVYAYRAARLGYSGVKHGVQHYQKHYHKMDDVERAKEAHERVKERREKRRERKRKRREGFDDAHCMGREGGYRRAVVYVAYPLEDGDGDGRGGA
ncbi:hypothetical protein JCM8547_008188 [Rhodosporidiobolus lusitaniae]